MGNNNLIYKMNTNEEINEFFNNNMSYTRQNALFDEFQRQ